MPSGLLGKLNLNDTAAHIVYSVPATKTGTVNCYFTNRTTATVKVRLASVPSGVLGDLADADYIEFDASIPANGVLERMGIPVSALEALVFQSNTAGVSAQVRGFVGAPAKGEE